MTHLLQTSQALRTFLRLASASAARSLCDTRCTWGFSSRVLSFLYAGEPFGRGLASEPGVDMIREGRGVGRGVGPGHAWL